MSILTQKTLKRSITLSGVGIHTGVKSNIKIYPALPNTGINFIRTDLKNNIIRANYKNVIQLYVLLYLTSMETKFQQ